MEVREAIILRRTKRKFLQKKVSRKCLEELIELSRFAPMGANLQGLKYMIIDEQDLVREVFSYTKWSGYHPENAPGIDEAPAAFIAMLGDLQIKKNGSFETDAGAAGTVILLGAESVGLSTCWLGAINREKISELLKLSDRYSLLYLIAVGYSEQEARSVEANGDIKYFTDADGVLNVPKRKLEEILINI